MPQPHQPPIPAPAPAALRCLSLYLERLGGEHGAAAAAGCSALSGSALGGDLLGLLREVLCEEEFLNYRPSGGRRAVHAVGVCMLCMLWSCCDPKRVCAVRRAVARLTAPQAGRRGQSEPAALLGALLGCSLDTLLLPPCLLCP